MIFDIDKRVTSALAAIDDSGKQLTNGELCSFTENFQKVIDKRTLIFILSENSIGSLAGYVASLSSNIVPLILSSNTDEELLNSLVNIYNPEYLWVPEVIANKFNFKSNLNAFNFCLLKTDLNPDSLYEHLALLLPTSGSTGSPKLVRHSYSNIFSNAKNVAAFFELEEDERPIAILPMHYTMGLSVITSHLYVGATILLVKRNLTEKAFWDFIKTNRATSFTGVPYSYEVLSKLRVFRMDLPDLKIFTQGGGKLRDYLFKEFADYAQKNNKKFIATYGQTEATARMAYLPAELAKRKTGSIGFAIPNGKLWLVDDDNKVIDRMEAEGQMVYSGPNVTLGYANVAGDLKKGDENNGVLYTGDIARRDADACYYIIGRMKRFLKIYGFRVGLDEIEQIVKASYNIDCLCTGNDDQLRILITNKGLLTQVKDLIVRKTGLYHGAINIEYIESINKNEVGKTIYN
jgi:acyl-coenzyme A synthetase/AMP-(fatty) acid ligase